MAAIALAESRGNSDARNDKDNNGTQSSFGAWQISTGTHTPPSKNWNDLNVNAALAVGKYKSQGLDAWGTYTSGAWKKFMRNGVPASNPGTAGPLGSPSSVTAVPASASDIDANCAWNVNLLTGNTCIASKTQIRVGLSILTVTAGVLIALTGFILVTGIGLGAKKYVGM